MLNATGYPSFNSLSRLSALLIALLCLCYPAAAQIQIVDAYPNLNFSQPIDYQVADSSSSYVYVAERAGRVKRFENSEEVSNAEVILDIRDKVESTGEGGLLGLAYHPDYPDSNSVFVYYTAPDPFRSIVARYRANPSTHQIDESSEQILLEIDQPATNHNAGQIRFGPDGYLYIALGDGGGANDQFGNGQDRTTLLGSILRIDIDHAEAGLNYAIPPDNPYVNNDQGYREEIYAYGLRNPYRFSFDAKTGALWAGDVGQNEIEEVDIIEKGGNYGWNIMEGSECFEPPTGCDQSGLTLPVYDYRDRAARQSITGGFVYRGSNIPELQGRYVYADFEIGKLWSFDYDYESETASDNQEIGNVPSAIAFGEDQDRELYICSIIGTIYKLEADPTSTEQLDEQPDRVKLHQNYPNPFNPTTEITFELPAVQHVQLKVFNSMGQHISTLIDRRMGAGSHQTTFSGKGLTSGVYFYKLETLDGVQSRKMILIK